MTDSAEQDLIDGLQAGELSAIEALYNRYSGAVGAVARRIVGSPADAEDVVQETFLQVWQQASTFDPGRAGLRAWVLMIARSRSLDRLRRGKGRCEHGIVSMEYALAAPNARQESHWVRVQHGALWRELDALPAVQRLTVDLAFFEGLTHAEIAETLQVPLGTVKTRIRIAVRHMRNGMNGRASVVQPRQATPFASDIAEFLSVRAKRLPQREDLRGRRLCVVDDDPDTVEIVATTLRSVGAVVMTALSSERGLEQFATGWPDVVIADVVMPAVDGYTFIRAARARAVALGRPLRAAALTALGERARAQARAAGFDALIAKPVLPEVLLETVGSLATSG